MTRYLICFAFRPQLPVARRAARNFLRHTFDLLSNSLYFLFGCLPSERRHALSSLRRPVKQEVFRFGISIRGTGNANDRHHRLSTKET